MIINSVSSQKSTQMHHMQPQPHKRVPPQRKDRITHMITHTALAAARSLH